MLEEIRFLLNFKMDAQSPMALILVGQTELYERFQLQAYAAIRQRIDLVCRMGYYDRSQVGAYVKRHLAYAGAAHDIFSDAALDEIFRYSGGAARLVNKVCTHCLLYGAQNGRKIIDDHMVNCHPGRTGINNRPAYWRGPLGHDSINSRTLNTVYLWTL
jgi:type II secretory pathway predicted ATPase ExeA